MSVLVIFAWVVFAVNGISLWQVITGNRRMGSLGEKQLSARDDLPLVSIIVPACNEESTLEPAIRSLLKQDYPALELIVIDDRSTDGTYRLLKTLEQEFPELHISRITQLPQGWLGKNHALHQGAGQAQGQILLFTDADVIMEPSTVSRAVACFLDEQLDHLCLIFRNVARGNLLNAMVIDALGGLLLLLKPWNVKKKGSRSFIGVGAFNMISRKSYALIGGHSNLRMHPIDDIMLGKKVKTAGMRQQCLLGTDFISVKWYATVKEMVCGLMKNVFALYSYRVSYALLGIFAITTVAVAPLWGLLLSQGGLRIVFAGALLFRLLLFVINCRAMRVPYRATPFSLLTPYVIIYIVCKAVVTTLYRQGIDWRGTRYPLAELKKEEPLITSFPLY